MELGFQEHVWRHWGQAEQGLYKRQLEVVFKIIWSSLRPFLWPLALGFWFGSFLILHPATFFALSMTSLTIQQTLTSGLLENNIVHHHDFWNHSSLSGPFHISLSAYAAQEPGCKEKVKTAESPEYSFFLKGFQQQPHSLHVCPCQLWSSVHVDAGWILI